MIGLGLNLFEVYRINYSSQASDLAAVCNATNGAVAANTLPNPNVGLVAL